MFECDIANRRSWRYYACGKRSGVTLCTLFMVLDQYRMYQCWLHTVLWSHIDILMRLLAAEPRSTAGLLFSSHCFYEAILATRYSMMWDRRVFKSRANAFFSALNFNKNPARSAMLPYELDQCYQAISQPVNQTICILLFCQLFLVILFQ